jgi:hypothetical protein
MVEKTKGVLLPSTWPEQCTNRVIETYLMLQHEISYNSHRHIKASLTLPLADQAEKEEAMIYGRRRAVAWKPLAGG